MSPGCDDGTGDGCSDGNASAEGDGDAVGDGDGDGDAAGDGDGGVDGDSEGAAEGIRLSEGEAVVDAGGGTGSVRGRGKRVGGEMASSGVSSSGRTAAVGSAASVVRVLVEVATVVLGVAPAEVVVVTVVVVVSRVSANY